MPIADRRTQAADEAPELCIILSSFFVDKVNKIRDIIRSDLLTMPAVSFSFEIQRCETSISHFTTVTVEEVKRVIAAMPAKSSPFDYISNKLLKEQVNVLALLVTRLANLSLSSGIFPSLLKTGQVTPLLKKPGLNPSDPASYRPITNLSTLSKILEKLTFNRLRQHIVS